MRILIQKVKSAKVTSKNALISEIGVGLLLFIGFDLADTFSKIPIAANKIAALRVWPSKCAAKRWQTNAAQNEYEILAVSQFTLCAEMNGNKPNFQRAKTSAEAKPLFEAFVEALKARSAAERVKSGVFGGESLVESVNDGPFNLVLDF